MLEKEQSKIEIEKIIEDKNVLDEMFQDKLKKNLKVCVTLDKDYPNTFKESDLEVELKKTLNIYSRLPSEGKRPDFEAELKEIVLHKLDSTTYSETKPRLVEQEIHYHDNLKSKPVIQKEKIPLKKQPKTIVKEKIKSSRVKERLKPTTIPIKKDKKEIKDIKKSGIGTSKTFFTEDIMQKIRFLHYRVKAIEDLLQKRDSEIDINNLQLLHEYANFLNVNYKTQSQIKILRELDISPSFYDSIEKRDIQIWDLMLECARVYFILGKVYSLISNFYETKNDFNNAISCMINCSKAFKTAAYFSAAQTRQENTGTVLSAKNLEIKSEETRIIAQNLAIKKDSDDLFLTSKMYSGLAALLNRLHFLKKYESIEESQLRALISYYKGKACHLKAKGMANSSSNMEIYDDINVINLQKKANYYFIYCEEIWEKLLKSHPEVPEDQIAQIQNYLITVNEEIMENDVELIDSTMAEKIQDPEPFIAIPENLSFCMPKSTKFLTNYPNTVMEKKSMDFVNSEQASKPNDPNILKNQKAGIGRTIKQIRILYESGDIDVNKFTELFEKYSTRIIEIEEKISHLKKGKNPQ
ncbi:MAG: hypothetical protein ACTSP9_08255 [Promethearchaeota archaeon]